MFILKSKDRDVLTFTKEFHEGEYIVKIIEIINLNILPVLVKLVKGKESKFFNLWIKNRSISDSDYPINQESGTLES